MKKKSNINKNKKEVELLKFIMIASLIIYYKCLINMVVSDNNVYEKIIQ